MLLGIRLLLSQKLESDLQVVPVLFKDERSLRKVASGLQTRFDFELRVGKSIQRFDLVRGVRFAIEVLLQFGHLVGSESAGAYQQGQSGENKRPSSSR